MSQSSRCVAVVAQVADLVLEAGLLPAQAALDPARRIPLPADRRKLFLGDREALVERRLFASEALQSTLGFRDGLLEVAERGASAIALFGEAGQLALARVQLPTEGPADGGQIADYRALPGRRRLELIDSLQERRRRQLGLGPQVGVGPLELLDVVHRGAEQVTTTEVTDRCDRQPRAQEEDQGAGRHLCHG